MSWVLRVATNLWRDRLRGRQDYPLTRDIEDPGARDTPERRETVLEVSQRLDSLPAVYRIALTLRFLNGLDYEAMSNVLGIAQATIRMQIARGVRLLREEMDGEVHR
jgi:RNA polymerase sigma-70 factor (ECF subfamily)